MTRSVAARSRGQGGTGGWVMVRVLGTRPLIYFDFPEELGKDSPEAVMGCTEGRGCERTGSQYSPR